MSDSPRLQEAKEAGRSKDRCRLCERVCAALYRVPIGVCRCLKKNSDVVTAAATFAMAVLGGLQFWALLETNENTRLTHRAFVNIAELQSQGLIENDEVVWWIFPTWQNSGDTPTRNLHVETFCPPVGEPEVWRENDLTPHRDTKRGLGAKQIIQGIKCVLTATQILDSQKRGLPIYVTALAVYEDQYSKTPRRTEFCARVVKIDGDLTDTKSRLKIFYTLCDDHNCTDKECESQ